jgi:hypothetical protein
MDAQQDDCAVDRDGRDGCVGRDGSGDDAQPDATGDRDGCGGRDGSDEAIVNVPDIDTADRDGCVECVRRDESGDGTQADDPNRVGCAECVGRDGSVEATTHTKSDYPTPPVLNGPRRIIYWDEEEDATDNYRMLGDALAAVGDVYRAPPHASGLTVASADPRMPPVTVKTGKRLAAVITDRIRVRVRKEGRDKGSRIPGAHLDGVLLSEVFLQRFRPIDAVVKTPYYLPDFTLAGPGYHNYGPGHRVIYAGPVPTVAEGMDAINAFLNIMQWATLADRTNAVAAALTVMLRRFWPGAKPIILASATKSQAGKDTVLAFAAGATPRKSISYQRTDWPLEQAIVAALSKNPDVGMLVVENARLGQGERFIASGCLERMATATELCLHSTKEKETYQRPNDLVLGISTNFSTVSEDLANRGLPIHLAPIGDIHNRVSPVGNPQYQYLPAYRDQLQAELLGFVARWVAAGRPLDTSVRHPMTEWAQTVGGILQVAGLPDFLANYGMRKVADDPLRRAIGLAGAARPGEWLRPGEWARVAVQLGLAKDIVPDGERDTDAGRERGIGVVFSAHRDETFHAETDAAIVKMRLEKRRCRWEPGAEAETRYRFVVTAQESLPEDPSPAP